MFRFFALPSDISESSIRISGEDAAHIKVLRLRQNETVTICDGNGTDYLCHLLSSNSHFADFQILDSKPSDTEPSISCALFCAFPKADKAEEIVRKAVELGAASIYFFPSIRSVSRPSPDAITKKINRLNKISGEAAKQSARSIIPLVSSFPSFSAAVAIAAQAALPLFLYEEELLSSISNHLGSLQTSVSLMSGAEGGFDPIEAKEAINAGILSVSLGKRILRCETAPIAALSAIMLASPNL